MTASSQQQQQEEEEEEEQEQEGAADLGIPLGDAPVPSRPGQPCPPGIAAIKLTIAETARLARLARQHAAGLISDARLAFHLRWSRWRRRAAAATVTNANRKEVTLCNRRAGTITSQNAA